MRFFLATIYLNKNLLTYFDTFFSLTFDIYFKQRQQQQSKLVYAVPLS